MAVPVGLQRQLQPQAWACLPFRCARPGTAAPAALFTPGARNHNTNAPANGQLTKCSTKNIVTRQSLYDVLRGKGFVMADITTISVRRVFAPLDVLECGRECSPKTLH